MDRRRDVAGESRWGWRCPKCDADAAVSRDPDTETFRWECSNEGCPAVGFGFTSRRRARIALGEYRDESEEPYR